MKLYGYRVDGKASATEVANCELSAALTARMKEMALREKNTYVAADILSDAAFHETLVGNSDEASRYATEAAKLGGEPPTALMLPSDPTEFQKIVSHRGVVLNAEIGAVAIPNTRS